jgi:hypothetical protein
LYSLEGRADRGVAKRGQQVDRSFLYALVWVVEKRQKQRNASLGVGILEIAQSIVFEYDISVG